MTLSPVAAVIAAAFAERHELCGPFDDNWPEQCLAAALRAAADQVVPKDADPVWGTDIDWAKWRALDDVRDELLGIAAELEGTRPTREGDFDV
jgi:hypothetical protein